MGNQLVDLNAAILNAKSQHELRIKAFGNNLDIKPIMGFGITT